MISGIQIHVTINIDVSALAEMLDLEEETIVALWNDGELEGELSLNGDFVEELANAPDGYTYGVQVGSGYL